MDNQMEESIAYQKVLHWFFAFPYKKVSLNELAKNLAISKANANKIVIKLTKEGFLVKEVIGKTWQVSCNVRHPYNQEKKIPYNLELVYNSKIIKKINEKFSSNKSIILFGSYRKGDDTEKSDIDIAVEQLGNKKLEIIDFFTFENFGYRKKVKVNIHVFSRENININLFANISNGIVLDGFLEVKK